MIRNDDSGKSFDLISNAGTISGVLRSIYTGRPLTTLINSGTISASNSQTIFLSSSPITTFTNSGTISSVNGNTLLLYEEITTLNNTGTITVTSDNTAVDINIANR